MPCTLQPCFYVRFRYHPNSERVSDVYLNTYALSFRVGHQRFFSTGHNLGIFISRPFYFHYVCHLPLHFSAPLVSQPSLFPLPCGSHLSACGVVWCGVVLCCVMLCCVVLCCVVLCCVACRAVPCRAVACRGVAWRGVAWRGVT